MRNKWKVLVMCLVMAAVVLLEPVSYVRAEDVYSEDMPYLVGLNFNMMVNSESNRDVVLDTVMKSKTVDYFIFKFDELEDVNYSNFEIVFDITLKSQLADGTVTTHNRRKIFDVVSSSNPGAFEDFLMFVGLKDSYYQFSMAFDSLVRLSPDCIASEKWVGDNLNFTAKKVYEYNTVVTRVDCFLRQKLTGKHGLISRFDLTWDSDFLKSLCTNVTYELVEPVTGEVLDSGTNENLNGAYGYDSDGDNLDHEARSVLSDIIEFFTDVPTAIVALVTGFFRFGDVLKELILVVFPFLPGGFVNILLLMLGFILLIGVCKFVQGWFG